MVLSTLVEICEEFVSTVHLPCAGGLAVTL